MPRQARVVIPGIPLHVVHRGHNRQRVFHSWGDHVRYLENLESAAAEWGCSVHAYVLMPNHVHFLLTPDDEGGPAGMMKRLAQDHAQYMNWKHRATGAFWQGRFFSCPVDSDRYLLACYRYIELNPVRAQLAASPHQFPWSSFRANGLGVGGTFIQAHPNYLELGRDASTRLANYQGLFDEAMPAWMLKEIRRATRSGMAFGTQGFCERLEAATGIKMSPPPMGRPARIVTTQK